MAGRGLGRGLGSLLGILDDEEVKPKVKEEKVVEELGKVQVPEGEIVEEIAIGLIDNNPGQPQGWNASFREQESTMHGPRKRRSKKFDRTGS